MLQLLLEAGALLDRVRKFIVAGNFTCATLRVHLVTQRTKEGVQKVSQSFNGRLAQLLGALVPCLKQKCSNSVSFPSLQVYSQEVLLSKVRQTDKQDNKIKKGTIKGMQIMLLSTLKKRKERPAGLRRKRHKWEESQDLTTVYSGWHCWEPFIHSWWQSWKACWRRWDFSSCLSQNIKLSCPLPKYCGIL